MAEAIVQAKRERELTKAALAADVDRLEGHIRAELDWKAKLRRDGPRYAVIATVVVVAVAGGLVLRRALPARDRGSAGESEAGAGSLEEITNQLREIRKELDGRHRGGSPLWHKVVLRATTAAGAAAGSLAARQMMDRFGRPGGDGGTDDALLRSLNTGREVGRGI
ncbi:MAG: hypothetical protein ABR564_05695 [Candidatus Dormibacteria bacterium]